jgi:hypothetical protein
MTIAVTNRTIGLKRQQVLLLKPGDLVVNITKNNLPKVQDAHLSAKSA